VVVWAVLLMAVAGAATGVPPSRLLATLQGGEEAVGALGATRRESKRVAWLCRAVANQGRDASARARHVQNACSAHAQSTHGTCSTKCQGMLEVLGEVGV